MTIACEMKNKPSGQMEPALHTNLSKSTEQIMQGFVENGVPSKTPLLAKDATSSRKGGTGRQQGATQDIYLASNYYNYHYPGYNEAYCLWDGTYLGARDGLSMVPQPYYQFQPSGEFYVPGGMYPSFRYPKQAQFQSSGPMVPRSKGRMSHGSSRLNSSWKSTRKGDCVASDELTCGPRVKKSNISTNSESEPTGVPGQRDKYNMTEFAVEYEHAKFYVIKSYSEDDVHRCIKYNFWSSTPNGNKRLDAAFHDAKVKVGESGKCPVFLFFSVNGSGQFVGLAEMIGNVDFSKDMDFWQHDKWSGSFPVKWHIVKDIPNAQLRHILLENNGNKPVTYTRDTQEIELKEGLEMLKVFKGYSAKSSILDDLEFYETRERATQARKSFKSAAQRTKLHSEDLQNSMEGQGMDGKALEETKTVPESVLPLVDLTKNLTIN